MKRLLSILLVMAMLFTMVGLAACSDDDDEDEGEEVEETEEVEEDEEEEEPEEEDEDEEEEEEPVAAGEFNWNGYTEVWSIVPTMEAEGLIMINDFMADDLTDAGWTHAYKDAQGDPGNQVGFVEDAIAAGNVGALMVAAMDVASLENAVTEAIEEGIIVVMLGAAPTDYEICGAVYTAYELTGMWAVELAESWIELNYDNLEKNDDGEAPVALDTYDDIQDGQYRSNAFRDRTEESDVMWIANEGTTYGDDAINAGFDWAETVMTANPELRVFICYEPECMVGVTSYLEEYAADNGLDLADFCVVNCYTDSAQMDIHELALDDASATAYKGYVTYGDEGDVEEYGDLAGLQATGGKLAEIIQGASDGTWDWNEIYYDTINVFGTFDGAIDYTWQMGETNPAEQYKY